MNVVKGPDSDTGIKLKQLIDEHQTSLLRLCYLYLHDVQLAEDAVQETFIKAVQALHTFRGDSSEKTWLISIARRTCCSMRRSFWFRRMDRRVTLDMLPDTPQEPEKDYQELTLAVMNLPMKLREAVILYYYQEMNVNEISVTLGISQPSVSNRLKRARDKLRNKLEGRYEP